jgi:hypothetical protein
VTLFARTRPGFLSSATRSNITDDFGKELDTLHGAYVHARKLIDKILFHVGHNDAEPWTVVILNDQHDAEMIIPISVSQAKRQKAG